MPLYRFNAKVVFFVHIPKTGGTSIEQALRELGCAEALYFPKTNESSQVSWQHIHARIYRELLGSGFFDYSFAIVRNPFDRIASEYKMKGGDAGGRRTFDSWFAKLIVRFAESSYVRDNHIRTQSDFLSDGVEIFRFENGLQAPLASACGVLGVSPPQTMPHARGGVDGLIECSAESLKAVINFYRRDFDRLDYAVDSHTNAFRVTR